MYRDCDVFVDESKMMKWYIGPVQYADTLQSNIPFHHPDSLNSWAKLNSSSGENPP